MRVNHTPDLRCGEEMTHWQSTTSTPLNKLFLDPLALPVRSRNRLAKARQTERGRSIEREKKESRSFSWQRFKNNAAIESIEGDSREN